MDDIVVTGASLWMARESGPSKESLAPAKWLAQPAKLSRMDRLCALSLVAADAALLDAGAVTLAAERTAVVLGTAYGCHVTNEEYYRGLLKEGPAGASPRLFAYTLPSSPVGEISIHYGIRGPATTVAPGLQAGLSAVAEGAAHLSSGRADRVIVIAAEVASALLQQIVGHAVRDVAAAVVLERGASGKARITSVVERFTAAPSTFPDETLGATGLVRLVQWLQQPQAGVVDAIRIDAADPAGGVAVLEAFREAAARRA